MPEFEEACRKRRYYDYLISRKEGAMPTFEGISLEKEYSSIDKDAPLEVLRKKRDAQMEEASRWVRIKNKKEKFFKQLPRKEELKHYYKMSYWSLEEAVALSFCRNPEKVNSGTLTSIGYTTDFGEKYNLRQELIKRAIDAGLISKTVNGTVYVDPFKFIKWASKINLSLPRIMKDELISFNIKNGQELSLYEAIKHFSDPMEHENLERVYRQIPRLKNPSERNFNYRKVSPDKHPMETLFNSELKKILKKFTDRVIQGELEIKGYPTFGEIEVIEPLMFERMVTSDGVDYVNATGYVGSSKITGIVVSPKDRETSGVGKGKHERDTSSNSPLTKKKPGRPCYDWDSFGKELKKRKKDNKLPQLQKSCVQEMSIWCKNEWDKVPGETSLKNHIRPFYKSQS